MRMHCFSCGTETEFQVLDAEEGPVCACGNYQDSEAQGAAELCLYATWHDLDAYAATADIARAGGFVVPASPSHFH